MDDLRVVLRDCTPRSLVMIDELGKGTSSRDGAAIAGALLEYLDKTNASGIFATHLHEILELPLKLKGVQRKKMGMKMSVSGLVTWTYLLEDGECLDSLALETARRYGLPSALISRAEELSTSFDLLCRPSRSAVLSNYDSQKGLYSEPGKIDKNIDSVVKAASRRYKLEGNQFRLCIETLY
jgi:DNA mismatch repair ATPase MutS